MITVLFFGGWLGPVLPPIVWFLLKMFFFICFFILLRAALPRPRFDQLMSWGWKLMLPLALAQPARDRSGRARLGASTCSASCKPSGTSFCTRSRSA